MDELLGKAGEDPLIEDLDLGEAPASGTRITTETMSRFLSRSMKTTGMPFSGRVPTVRQRRFHMRRVSRPMTVYRTRRKPCGAA